MSGEKSLAVNKGIRVLSLICVVVPSARGLPKANSRLATDLRTLTSLRFFAAFWVFMFHLSLRVDTADIWFWNMIGHGARGVGFFFILSGFVILYVYGSQIGTDRFSIRQFTVKRVARIYPLHLAMLLACCLLILGGAGVSSIPWLPTNFRPLVSLGEISHSIYLVHLLVIRICMDFAPKAGIPALPWPVIGLAVILVSAGTYHFLENPARRWVARKLG
ncbi:acyltransferase family protein [Salipiger abyssi]|uniref:acyltransferase family protein n=1 Tax=Salipiger abyssi TaxID=1250539 RepID=UPI004059FD3D